MNNIDRHYKFFYIKYLIVIEEYMYIYNIKNNTFLHLNNISTLCTIKYINFILLTKKKLNIKKSKIKLFNIINFFLKKSFLVKKYISFIKSNIINIYSYFKKIFYSYDLYISFIIHIYIVYIIKNSILPYKNNILLFKFSHIYKKYYLIFKYKCFYKKYVRNYVARRLRYRLSKKNNKLKRCNKHKFSNKKVIHKYKIDKYIMYNNKYFFYKKNINTSFNILHNLRIFT